MGWRVKLWKSYVAAETTGLPGVEIPPGGQILQNYPPPSYAQPLIYHNRGLFWGDFRPGGVKYGQRSVVSNWVVDSFRKMLEFQ